MANEPMLKFVMRAAAPPPKRDGALRIADFREIAARYAPEAAREQAARCSQCGVPYCSVHCPLQNHIPDWLRLTAEGRLREAYELSNATSSMPEICGRICPQDRLCEGSCVIEQSGHGAVTIGAVEKYITDTAWAEGWVEPLRPGPDLGLSVGIIGAGPAGLSAAEQLRMAGYDVHIYDRHDRPGGLLTYGIPGFKLEKEVTLRRTDRLAAGGVQFHQGFDVGRDASFAALRQKHDALLIATGVYRARALDARTSANAGEGGNQNDQNDGIVQALDYLIASNRRGFGDTLAREADARLNAAGRRVLVIGGGDTAMDCARTAIRQGAASVRIVYRRDRANMPGSRQEVANAQEEGCDFVWLATPTGIDPVQGDAPASGALRVTLDTMRLGAPDATGRRRSEPVEGGATTVDADLVIQALGFEPEDLGQMFGMADLSVTRWGTLIVDPATGMTSLDGVFAAGDIVRGASLVVHAIRDGRDVAAAMARYLARRQPIASVAA